MVWPMIAMAAVSAVGSISSAQSASQQNENQAAWNRYNATMGYGNDMANIRSQTTLGMFNASLQMKSAEMNAAATLDVAEFNAQQVQDVSDYNTALLDEELSLLWEAEGLDQEILGRQRALERSSIVASQAASGTTIGYGSNADTVVNQRAEELMDAFVILHNADIGAAKIRNAQTQGQWQASQQIQKIMYEGQVGSAMMINNAKLAAAGTLFETTVSASAGQRSAEYRRDSGMAGADMAYSENQTKINASLTQGLFSSAASAVGAYYGGADVSTDLFKGVDRKIKVNTDKVMYDSMSGDINASLGSLMDNA